MLWLSLLYVYIYSVWGLSSGVTCQSIKLRAHYSIACHYFCQTDFLFSQPETTWEWFLWSCNLEPVQLLCMSDPRSIQLQISQLFLGEFQENWTAVPSYCRRFSSNLEIPSREKMKLEKLGLVRCTIWSSDKVIPLHSPNLCHSRQSRK